MDLRLVSKIYFESQIDQPFMSGNKIEEASCSGESINDSKDFLEITNSGGGGQEDTVGSLREQYGMHAAGLKWWWGKVDRSGRGQSRGGMIVLLNVG